MAVVKRSSSGLALQVVLSEDLPAGSVLQCSLSPVLKLVKANEFVLLTILPVPVSPYRFPKSSVWGQTGEVVVPVSSLSGVDAMSRRIISGKGVVGLFRDEEVDF